MEYILKTEALTKQYNKRNAIVNVDIAVRLGAVYGLVGRNGAGKTTIFYMDNDCIYSICGGGYNGNKNILW